MIEKIDIGNSVMCDSCNEDYSNSTESGGFLFGSYAYCPKCATPERLKKIDEYGELSYIKGYCPPEMSYKDWVLSLRGGDNEVKIYTGEDFDNLLDAKKEGRKKYL